MNDIVSRIHDYTLEEIMGERFGRYSKYIIQDRAIPDVRDGLKPVQRRILYAMYKTKNTYDHDYYKSASTVGEVIGKYHPHGDSSIYEAMVRMSQSWKMRDPHIDMHGNNGSIDGDSPAAYRYTEARLSRMANELLKDIDKDTVIMAPNFDDKHLEPTVLPCRYPNLLVNGSMGISAGYATNIPPHNLVEVIDATIYRIDNPNCRLDTIMNFVKGPDFPTGGIVCGIDGIRQAYETGRGKVVVKSKITKEKNKLVINEIPYEVNKANLVRKIDEIRLEKKIDGIVEARDESDKDGLQITIDLKKDANVDLILNYLLKNTELQINYNYNMVVIDKRRPRLLGIIGILDAYIEHQKEVVYKRSKFDLVTLEKEFHITTGLMKAISILDDVIKTIRASKNKSDAKENLIIKYGFSDVQAEAIVVLQLYKLTNTDIMILKERLETLKDTIASLNEIINNEDKLLGVIKDELRKIKKEYGKDRLTEVSEKVEEIKIDSTSLIPSEDVVVCLTKGGYIKRVPMRSYMALMNEDTGVKDNDYVIGLFSINTKDVVLIFTDRGNYLYLPVYDIPELKWKELGKHISNIIPLGDSERVIGAMPVYDFNKNIYITSFSKNGMVKRTKLIDYKVQRYSKPINMMKLKDDDMMVDVNYNSFSEVFVFTRKGYGLWYDISSIPVVGLHASGVRAISLKDDCVVNGVIFDKNIEYISIIMDKGTGKRLKISELEKGSRANRGVLLMKEIKSNPSRIVNAYLLPNKSSIGICTDSYIKVIKGSDIPIMDRYSNGSYVVKDRVNASYIVSKLISKDKDEVKEILNGVSEKEVSTNFKSNKSDKEISLMEVDDKIMTIDDLLKDIEKGE